MSRLLEAVCQVCPFEDLQKPLVFFLGGGHSFLPENFALKYLGTWVHGRTSWQRANPDSRGDSLEEK